MNAGQVVILGILQGLTEFLPVSSSGHLVIVQKILGINEPPVLFDILVHLGTLFSLLIYFNVKIINFYKKIPNLILILIGSIPAAVAGFFLNNYLEQIFGSLTGVGFSLLITAFFLFSTAYIKSSIKKINNLSWLDSLIIGLFQAIALLPGVSRSGSTIVSGLWRGLQRKSAFLFSFYLGIPAMIGAVILQSRKIVFVNGQLNLFLLGLITAAGSGLLSLKLLEKIVLRGKLNYFGLYCLFLGLTLLFFFT